MAFYLIRQPLTDNGATLPYLTPSVPSITFDGTTTTLSDSGNVTTNGTNLQAAINAHAARDGSLSHKIVLPAGVTFKTTSGFTLPAKSGTNPTGTGWIVITTDGAIPARNTRVQPSNAALLAKINMVATSGGDRAFKTAAGAHHYWLIGLEIAQGAGSVSNSGLVDFGNSAIDQTGVEARNLIIDRCYLHGQVDADYTAAQAKDLARAVTLNCGTAIVIDSWISEVHSTTQDTQAICGWNGTGPYLIQNNHLEAAGENVMFGGSDALTAGLIPSDITVRGNHCYKPPLWWQNDLGYSVKNLFEIKTAQRVLVENNVFENHWNSSTATGSFTHTASGQTKAINIKSNNQKDSGGAGQDWSVTNDITFRYNVVKNACGALGVNGNVSDAGNTTLGTNRISIHDNLFANIGLYAGSVSPNYMISGGLAASLNGVTIQNNTFHYNGTYTTNDGTLFWSLGDPAVEQGSGLIFSNNIVGLINDGGVKAPGLTAGTASISGYWGAGYSFTGNVIAGPNPKSISFPVGNTVVANQAAVGFTDTAGGDYTVTGTYAGKGADIAALNAKISGVV